MNEKISQKTARRMALHAQLLDGKIKIKKGKEGVAQAIGHLGYVQIDTISVIERAHHHTLWTRVPGYEPRHLHEALAIERSIFEYWGHAASYLPIKDYRFYMPMMRSFYDPKDAWYKGWGEKYGSYLGPVLERILKADRKTRTFLVRQLAIEPRFHDLDGLIPELSRAICELAHFNGCQMVLLENVLPKNLIAPLNRTLALEMKG